MFKKLLIANRGEIACRIIRTARRLGIYCIAIYSSEDARALHVRLADEAHWVGPAEARLSYLNSTAILAIAKACGAEAIHPGYGFLSENADFAEACERQRVCFIGAPSHAIRTMGSKIGAKQLLSAAGVPLLPGYHGNDQSATRLMAEAERIGFPVLIKASAGGGGKGMRIVHSRDEFLAALAACQREANTAFGDATVLLEKYLSRPRHIEMQIFADQHGNCLHLFERDCSIQRRYQKVLEEAPAPHFPPELRHQMGEAAIAAARSVAYVGAGTVEFLYEQGQFYFMEMNTRLQVEHPVTEAISGQDLVEWQLRIADGEALPLNQAQLSCLGHAIEARIYAEDPEQQFLPTNGTIQGQSLPTLSDSIRLDSGIQTGDRIGIYYDPMLAKLIAFGPNRDVACQLLQQALNQYIIGGVKTNLNFLARLIALDAYRQGELSTDFIAHHQASLCAPCQALPPPVLLFAVAQQLQQLVINSDRDPWQSLAGWQNGLSSHYQWSYEWQEQAFSVHVRVDANGWRIDCDHQSYCLQAWQQDHHQWRLRLTTGTGIDQWLSATVLVTEAQVHIGYQGQRYTLTCVPRFRPQVAAEQHDNRLLAPMPGRIIAHLCPTDQAVESNQPLLIMEAMKMEHTIRAPHAGILTAYLCPVGAIVNDGDLLVELT